RLRAPFGEVDDRQPAMSEAHALIFRVPLAKPVGAARGHMISNAPQFGAIDRVGSVMIGVDTCDAAHQWRFQPTPIPFVRNIDEVSALRWGRPASAERMPSKHCR